MSSTQPANSTGNPAASVRTCACVALGGAVVEQRGAVNREAAVRQRLVDAGGGVDEFALSFLRRDAADAADARRSGGRARQVLAVVRPLRCR